MGAAVEVVVIGGGIAGLCAAIAARRRGVSVRLVESAPEALRGGDARHARNFRFPHDAPTWHTPGVYTAEAFLAELQAVSGVEAPLARSLIEEAAEAPGWLAGCGVRLQAPDEGVLPFSRRTAFLHGGGKAMLNALYRAAAAAGVDIRYDSPALRLRAVPGGWTVEGLEARCVIIASGGPGGDPAFLRENLGASAQDLMIRGGAFSNGAMLRALIEEHGALTVGDPASFHMVAVDARGPRFDGGIVTRITAIPHGVVVDRDGQPLVDASRNAERSHYAQWGPRIAAAPGGLAYLILDAQGLACADPFAFAPLRADTPAALAAVLGVAEAALTRAVAALRPPFFAAPMRAGVTFAHYGLKVDAEMRMIGRKERAFEGLYAAGMIMAANILPRGYLAGLGLTLSAVTGRRAGEAAARHVRA